VENAIVSGRRDLRGRPGTDAAQAIDECSSLVHIRAAAQSAPALSQAARRIRHNVRHTDTILLLEQVCVIGLPATPLQGAQSIARRVAALLVDIDCEIQAYAGLSALTLWQRMLAQHALPVSAEEPAAHYAGAFQVATQDAIESCTPPHPMPYLAFIANYPPRRLLHLFPYELACRYRCVPVGAERDMLTLGTSQRLDESVIEQMRKITRRGIFQVRCDASMIEDMLLYWQGAQKLPLAVMEDI
jgi:MshEN domain